MNNETVVKVTKILAIVFLFASILIALLPCIRFEESLIDDMIGSSISVDNDVLDTVVDAIEDGLNGGAVGNVARSSIVVLGAFVVLTYSANKFVIMAYYLLLLVGIPVVTILSAVFQIIDKDKKKQALSFVFTIVCIVLAISVFIFVPATISALMKSAIEEYSTTLDWSLYSGAVRSIIFRVMVRCMSVGFWGFLVCQILALACIFIRYKNEDVVVRPISTNNNPKSSSESIGATTTTGKIMGVTGTYAGAEIALDGAGIIIGRDSKESQLIIDSPKVSRRHCSISYDKVRGMYLVIDYSSNGTFVGKRRLAKGMTETLPSGTVISIGDDRNSFRLQ